MAEPRKSRKSAQTTAKRVPAVRKIPAAAKPVISFGLEICGDLAAAEQREWLLTNGIGGFASGTVAGSSTRRYHGLLVAALKPPAGRTLLVAGLDEIVSLVGNTYSLATHRWASGAVAPQGHLLIEKFYLDGQFPVWIYKTGAVRIEKRIWMRDGENTTFVRYSLIESDAAVSLDVKALVNYRDFHTATHSGDWHLRIEPIADGIRVTPFDGATPFHLKSLGAAVEPQHVWYRDFFYPRESERGLDDREDHLLAAIFRSRLEKGQALTIVLSTEAEVGLDGAAALRQEAKRQDKIRRLAKALVATGKEPLSARLPERLPEQLVLAADQFFASRPLPGQPTGKTIIAGYHWFSDWGRDTMIALPGLTLATGSTGHARDLLLAFSRFVDDGMLPNNFPDTGGAPQYNTIDATLWFFEAIRQYCDAANDVATLKKLFPILAKIVDAHVAGTRFNIHVDPDDGLLYGGGPGVQLTWMDAKVGDWVVTPRAGKPVEINALWINALDCMAQFARELGVTSEVYVQLRARAQSSFRKFWNPERNFCFDVLDSPGIGNDPRFRPNQIFAVALRPNLLPIEQQKAIVDACASQLLTPFGLRSLAPGEPGYRGVYSGGPRERDAAYHQGTVWGWLLGPFALAHYRVYRDREAALAFLDPLARSVDAYGLGSLAEIFDGDPPHHPRGCIAQAWTVGELLRTYKFLFGEN